MKPTDLKLERLDPQVIRRIYLDIWNERHTSGGAETWFDTIMQFLEQKGYELKEKEKKDK